MDTAIVIKRLIGQDAMSNFTMASAEALMKLGKVAVYTFAYERPPVEGVDVRLLGGRNSHSVGTNLKALCSTLRLARELSQYDLLLIVDPDVGPMPACHLARRHNPRLRVMWTFHGQTPAEYVSGFRDRLLMRLRKPAYVWSMKRADRIQVFSDFIKKEIGAWGIDASKVSVVPFGVDLKCMASGEGRRIREKYGTGARFLCLYVGRLVNFKHVDELIKAVSTLEGSGLMVVGGGPERERLEALSKELHVDDRVWFAGRVPDGELWDYYAACDVWATASRHEGFCVPIVEAMAAGKPVIVPETAAMPETAGDGGLTYRQGSVKALSEWLRKMSTDKILYMKLASNAKARARAFDMAGVMGRYVEMVSGVRDDIERR